MAAGLLAGAIQGLGGAMQHNAQGQIEEKRKKALMALEQEMAMERQEDQQQFTAGEATKDRGFRKEERVATQDFTAGQNQLTREQERELAMMRERGATSRAAMGRNDSKVMMSSDGRPVLVNTRTGTIEPMDVPEGIDLSSGDITKREELYVKGLDSRIGELSDRLNDPAAIYGEEQQTAMREELDDLMFRRQQTLGMTNDAEVFGAHEGMGGGGSGGPPPMIARPGAQGAGGQGGGTDDSTASGYVAEREQQQAEAERNREADARVSEMTDEAKRIAGRLTIPDQFSGGFQRGGLLNRATGGGIDQQAERQAAQQVLAEIAAQHDAENDPDRKAQLEEAMDALIDAGVTLPQ